MTKYCLEASGISATEKHAKWSDAAIFEVKDGEVHSGAATTSQSATSLGTVAPPHAVQSASLAGWR